jgi:hypothetical protein
VVDVAAVVVAERGSKKENLPANGEVLKVQRQGAQHQAAETS